jgi:hypothetical protein
MAGELDVLTSILNVMNSNRGAASGSTVTQSGGDVVQSGGGGSTSSTGYSSPGDISALQALLGELGGANYEQVLQSIFSQAGGKIPGFMGALQNSVGARSGGNSAVAGMLQKLLSETVMQAQAQTADLGLRNAALRGQLGTSIAQATKGTNTSSRSVSTANPMRTVRTPQTTTTAPVKKPYGAGEMAAVLGAGSLFKNMWDSFRKDNGKQDGSNVPVVDSVGSSNITSAAGGGLLGGGEIFSDAWANSAPDLNGNNNIVSFTDGPNFLSDTGMQFPTGPSYSDFLSNDSPSFDFGDFDLGSLFGSGGGDSFDLGSTFTPEYGGGYDFTDEFWY